QHRRGVDSSGLPPQHRDRSGKGRDMFDWVVSTIESWGDLGVFVLMVAEHIFPPIPSEVIMPLAGFLAARGRMSLTLTIVTGTLGWVLCTIVWYGIGLWLGDGRFMRFAARQGRLLTLSPSVIDAAHDSFQRHGAMALFFGRMIPALRTLI